MTEKEHDSNSRACSKKKKRLTFRLTSNIMPQRKSEYGVFCSSQERSPAAKKNAVGENHKSEETPHGAAYKIEVT